MSAPHRVLVVEDEEMIRDSLVEILADSGYDAIAAVDGRDALDKLRTGSPRPCLILLDLMMPIMDGWSFREQQRSDPEHDPFRKVLRRRRFLIGVVDRRRQARRFPIERRDLSFDFRR